MEACCRRRSFGAELCSSITSERCLDCWNVIASTNVFLNNDDAKKGRKALAYDVVLRLGLGKEREENAEVTEVKCQKARRKTDEEGISEEERLHRVGNDQADEAEKRQCKKKETDGRIASTLSHSKRPLWCGS